MASQPTILVISSAGIVRFFTDELEQKGYHVRGATSVSGSFAAYQRSAPTLILVFDHFIEGAAEALALCAQLRALAGSDLPILLIASEFYRDEAIARGITWFPIVGGIGHALEHIQERLPAPHL
jgi:DNA-binding response OmpR family regulator